MDFVTVLPTYFVPYVKTRLKTCSKFEGILPLLLSKNDWKYEKEKEEKWVSETNTSCPKIFFWGRQRGIDPEYLCRTCFRLLEKINQD